MQANRVRYKAMNDDLPLITVIVPVRNGQRTIRDCLISLLKSDYPEDRREIVVVDNGSTDGTSDIVKEFPVRNVQEPRRGLSYARNRGIEATTGNLLAFTDSDCMVSTAWLRELTQGFESDDVGVVAGEVVSFPSNAPPERYMAIRKPRWQTRSLSFQEKPWFLSGCAAFRRKVFDEIGLYDTRFAGVGCEDIDFSWRFFKQNRFRLKYQPKAVVFHRHRLTARGLFDQYYRYGRGQRTLLRKHPETLSWSWSQEKDAIKDLLRTSFEFTKTAVRYCFGKADQDKIYFDYFETVRKLSERLGFLRATLEKS